MLDPAKRAVLLFINECFGSCHGPGVHFGLLPRYEGAGMERMEFTVGPVEVKEILPWRELYRSVRPEDASYACLIGRPSNFPMAGRILL
jgi:hypothetical protein